MRFSINLEQIPDEGFGEMAEKANASLLSPAQLSSLRTATFREGFPEDKPVQFQPGMDPLNVKGNTSLREDANIRSPKNRRKKQDCLSESTENEAAMTPRIKRPLNSFMLYRRMKQREIPPNHHQRVSRVIGALWNNETAETKAHFAALADIERETHLRDYPNYKYYPKRRKNDDLLSRAALNKPKTKVSADDNAEEMEILRTSSGAAGEKVHGCGFDSATAKLALKQDYTNNGDCTFGSQRFYPISNSENVVSTKPNHGAIDKDISQRHTSYEDHIELSVSKNSKHPVGPIGLGLSGMVPVSEPSTSISELGGSDADAYFASLQSYPGCSWAASARPYGLQVWNSSPLRPVEDDASL